MSPLRTLAFLAAALVLTGLLALSPPFERVDLWLDDAQQRLAAPEIRFKRTLVIDIDEASLRRLEPYLGVWPYRRDVFALVLDYLGEFGARTVVFDILMSERRPGDAELAAAATRNPDAVFAAMAQLSRPAGETPVATGDPARHAWTVPATLPVERWGEFQLPVIAAGGAGIASFWPDADGSVRRIPLFHRVGDASLPALALAATVGGRARPPVAYEPSRREVVLGEHRWPVDAGGRALLSFPGGAVAPRTLPFAGVVLAAMGAAPAPFTPGALQGVTVIIGSGALQSDAANTPRGLVPGAWLLALAHENLAGDLLRRPADAPAAMLLLTLALLPPLAWSLHGRRQPAILGATLAGGAALAWLGHLLLLGLWRQQSPLLAAWLALALFGAGHAAVLAAAERRRRRAAENQMRIAAAVFDSSREGVMVTDADSRIVSVNPAFTAITGYTAAEALGRDPSLLNSGRHDAAFFAAMWQALEQSGSWQGEIWNRRKDGLIYPQWLSIDTLRDADGKVDKRVAVFADLSTHKAAEERIDFLAHFDPLTGLPNRTLLRDRANLALEAATRGQTRLALLFIDLDRFRNLIDSLGHNVGDEILRQCAVRLQGQLAPAETLSRSGGDEFVLLLPGADAVTAAQVAGRLLDAVRRPFAVAGHEVGLTASIGIAEFPGDGQDFDTLSRCADAALHGAKQIGRNGFRFYAAEMHQRAGERFLLENDLRQAIARGELLLHYQPQVTAGDGHLVGLEALLRWQHPRRGLVSPAEFIPIAEESGLIGEIGEWVLKTALGQMRAWADTGLVPVPVAVNLSLAQFRQATLFDRLVDALHDSGLAAGMLELELTESVAMENISRTIESVDRMRELGVGLAIDDFGTGYSSLAYLKRFSVHKIKIDRSFVASLGTANNDTAIVRAIIGLAHNLGYRVVAEGVETSAQLEVLRQWGCDEIQGFHFSRPLPADAIAAILRAGVVVPSATEAGG